MKGLEQVFPHSLLTFVSFVFFVSFVVNLLPLTEMLVDTHTGARIYFVVLT